MPGTNPGTTGLISYWSLDEASGQRNDSHGTNHLADNATVLSAAGVVGNAADFEANNNENLSIADNASLRTGDIDFSLALWVRLESKTVEMAIIGKYTTTGNLREYLPEYSLVYDRFQFLVSPNGATPLVGVLANTLGSPAINTWYWIYCQHDSVNNLLGISVNNGTLDTAAHAGGVFVGASAFRIGDINSGGVIPYDGLGDEMLFAKRLYTADERTWLYNAGAGRAYSELAAGLAVPVAMTLPARSLALTLNSSRRALTLKSGRRALTLPDR